MTFDDYKFICFCHKIDPEIIETCREFVEKEQRWFDYKDTGNADTTLGFHELGEITTKEESIKVIQESIYMSTLDFDARGRNITNLRIKQLKKTGNKHLNRKVLKSYYLHYFDL